MFPFSHYGGIDEIALFAVPAVLVVLALRWAERRAAEKAADKENAAESADVH